MSGGSLFNSSADVEFDSEFDTQPESETQETSPSSVDELVDEVTEEEEEELDDEMSEAERRISLAGYYKILAKGGIFNDGSDEAKIVDKQVRAFCREQVIVLLNLPSQKPPAEPTFNELQIDALRCISNRMIERQSLPTAPAAPVVRSLAAPVASVAARPIKPAGPQIKVLSAPPGAKKPAPAPVKKPVVKVAPTPLAKAPVKKKDFVHTPENTPVGEMFEENGKKYKFVNHPENGDILKINVTASRRQVAHPGSIPMPSVAAMEQLSEQIAHMNVNSNPAMKSNQLITAAAMSAANREE